MIGIHDHLLQALWRKGPDIYKTVGIIYDPAVEIEDVRTGERFTLVLSSLIALEYECLEPELKPVRK